MLDLLGILRRSNQVKKKEATIRQDFKCTIWKTYTHTYKEALEISVIFNILCDKTYPQDLSLTSSNIILPALVKQLLKMSANYFLQELNLCMDTAVENYPK